MVVSVIWHYWLGVVLFFASLGAVLAVAVGYLVKVQSLKYPKK